VTEKRKSKRRWELRQLILPIEILTQLPNKEEKKDGKNKN